MSSVRLLPNGPGVAVGVEGDLRALGIACVVRFDELWLAPSISRTVPVGPNAVEAVTEAETESVIEAESVTVAVTVSVSVSESETESEAETEAVTAVLAGLRQAANQLNSGILFPGGSLGAKLRHAGELQQLDRQD